MCSKFISKLIETLEKDSSGLDKEYVRILVNSKSGVEEGKVVVEKILKEIEIRYAKNCKA